MNTLNTYNVCFLGRTGNGKSTLINALYGTTFQTAPLLSCTKELYTVTLMGNCPEGFDAITVYDTPGIGEFSSNSAYQCFYMHAAAKAHCVVLVTTFDRTDAPAQRLMLELRQCFEDRRVKFVAALNHIDSAIVAADTSYTPWDEAADKPTEKCLANIAERTDILHQRFDKYVDGGLSAVVPVCGIRNYGIHELKAAIELF